MTIYLFVYITYLIQNEYKASKKIDTKLNFCSNLWILKFLFNHQPSTLIKLNFIQIFIFKKKIGEFWDIFNFFLLKFMSNLTKIEYGVKVKTHA